MNSSTLIDKIAGNLNRSDATRALVLDWLNNRMLQIENTENFYLMESTFDAPTVVGQRTYSLPSNYKDELQITLVSGTTKFPLIKWVGSEAENSFANTTQQAQPTNYWVWSGAYFLYPIPNAIYTLTLKCYLYLDKFTDTAAEENDLGVYWPDLMIYGATAEGFHYFMQADKVAEWETKFQNELQKLLRRDTKKRYSNYTPRMRLRIK